MKNEYRRAFSVLGMKFEIITNFQGIIEDDEYFMGRGGYLHSLLSNFHQLVPLEGEVGETAFQVVLDNRDGDGSALVFSRKGHEYHFTGPIRKLEENCGDKRISIFGNMGIFSKILVRELELHGIFSFHSTSFLVPGSRRLILVLGGSGAGKSTVLLKAVQEGLQIFGTELTHVAFRNGQAVFMKGSLWQNCRMGNLVEDFPALLKTFDITDIPEGNPWKQYRSIDMSPWQYSEDIIEQPELTILFPRIESERSLPERYQLDPENLSYPLYENLSDKVTPPSHIYKSVFIPSLDLPEDQIRRMKAAAQFTGQADIKSVWKVLTSPDECLETII